MTTIDTAPSGDREAAPKRWAWVIGGSGGIGAAIATTLAAEGWEVVAGGRAGADRHDPGVRVHPTLVAEGPQRWSLAVDVTDDRSVRAAVDRILARAGRLDAVVVAARTPGQGTFMAMPDAEWQLALDTKLLGLVRVARATLPVLEASSGSLVSLVGSAAGFATVGHPLGCINAAVRHAVRGLALEWSPRGVRVLGVSPGPTATPSLDALLDEQATARGIAPREIEAEVAGPMFRKRLLRPEEVASLVAFALGPHGAVLNGTVVLADDGATGGTV